MSDRDLAVVSDVLAQVLTASANPDENNALDADHTWAQMKILAKAFEGRPGTAKLLAHVMVAEQQNEDITNFYSVGGSFICRYYQRGSYWRSSSCNSTSEHLPHEREMRDNSRAKARARCLNHLKDCGFILLDKES